MLSSGLVDYQSLTKKNGENPVKWVLNNKKALKISALFFRCRGPNTMAEKKKRAGGRALHNNK